MPARCETCHFWIPGDKYVEGGEPYQQVGFCKFTADTWKTQASHWCGRWSAPVIASEADTPAHTIGTAQRYSRDRAASAADTSALEMLRARNPGGRCVG